MTVKAKTPTVTLLTNQTDLQLLIDALREHDTRRADEMANSFQKLMDAAFPTERQAENKTDL